MPAGSIRNLHVVKVGLTSFTVAWTPAVRATGYRYDVRDLTAHRHVTSGQTNDATATVPGLQAGRRYNFGVQGLPGGPGANIHIKTIGGTAGTGLPLRGITYRAFAAVQCVRHGWGLGRQWRDWQWIEAHEAGWDANARNPDTGAYGIAQALGHGTARTAAKNGENNYGNFGTSDTVCRAANAGNGYAQVVWMGNYLEIKWGSPSNARAHYNQGY